MYVMAEGKPKGSVCVRYCYCYHHSHQLKKDSQTAPDANSQSTGLQAPLYPHPALCCASLTSLVAVRNTLLSIGIRALPACRLPCCGQCHSPQPFLCVVLMSACAARVLPERAVLALPPYHNYIRAGRHLEESLLTFTRTHTFFDRRYPMLVSF